MGVSLQYIHIMYVLHRRNQTQMTQGMMLPWVFPRLVTSASMRRIPRRSCESSQRADRVGSDRDVQVDVF